MAGPIKTGGSEERMDCKIKWRYVTGSTKSSMFVCFTQVHTNACNFLTDAPIYICFTGNIVWSFGIYCDKYGAVIGNHYKITML